MAASCERAIDIPRGQTPVEPHGYRAALRQAARADRPRFGSRQPPAVLDRPRRPAPRQHGKSRTAGRATRAGAPLPEIVFTHLMEGIGLALDPKHGRMFITDFGGSVYSANLDGSDPKTLVVAEGNLTASPTSSYPRT